MLSDTVPSCGICICGIISVMEATAAWGLTGTPRQRRLRTSGLALWQVFMTLPSLSLKGIERCFLAQERACSGTAASLTPPDVECSPKPWPPVSWALLPTSSSSSCGSRVGWGLQVAACGSETEASEIMLAKGGREGGKHYSSLAVRSGHRASPRRAKRKL